MTLSNLIEKLKIIQEEHPMIRTFGEGDIYDYTDNGGEIVYPVFLDCGKAFAVFKHDDAVPLSSFVCGSTHGG